MIGDAPLAGRQDVLAYVGGVLARGSAGSGGLVLVTGEPGIGKTRVAEEVARAADGFAIHWTWCTAEQSSGSLRPWSLLLRGLTTNTRVAERVQQSPPLRTLLAGSGDTSELSASLLSDDLVDVLRLAATERPQLLVMDDLHDATPSSLRLLQDVTAGIRTSSLVVLATARDSAKEWAGRETQRAALLGQAHRLALGALDPSDVRTLLGPEASEAQAVRLWERTGGNALLVTEMARATEDVPASLRAMVTSRASRLSAEAREVLAAASTLGARFRLDVLADTTGRPLAEVSALLHESMDAALLVTEEPGRGRFTHELLRDLLFADLSPSAKQGWHRRAGESLAALHHRGREVEAAEVAFHLLQADEPERALPVVVEAARRAVGMGAFEDAVGWYTTAVDLALDPEQQTALLLERARARRGCGDADAARDDLLRAASLAPSPAMRAQAALAMGTGIGGFEVDALDGEQVQLLHKTLAALPEDELSLRAQLLARLSVASSRLEDPAQLLAWAEQAVALGRQSGDPLALAGALAALCDATAGPDHVQQRLQHASDIISLAPDAPELELLGRRLRLVALLELGDRSGAEREALAYELRATALRHPLYLWYVPLWKGFWALAEGRYDDCRALTEEAARIGAGSENAWMLAVTQSLCRMVQEGAVDELAQLFLDTDLSEQLGTWAVVARAFGLHHQGEPAQAIALLETVAPLVPELPRDSEWLAEMMQVATVVAGTDHWLGAWIYVALQPYAELFVIEGIGAATHGPVHRLLALVAPESGARARHQAASEAALRRVGAVALLGRGEELTEAAAWLLEGDTWKVRWRGRETRVRDSKGMRDLANLLAAQGKEIGALDLYGPGAVLEHDTGEVLDAAAREAYKGRLRDLEEQDSLSEPEALEREALLDQLAGAYGLGGRVRRTGSSAERARSAVTARVRDTIKRIAALDADLGQHLAHSVRTGTFCSYVPEQSVAWHLTP